MHEEDLRTELRSTMTITPPPPMDPAATIAAGRSAVRRRRAALAGAGAVLAIAAIAVPTAYLRHPSPPPPTAAAEPTPKPSASAPAADPEAFLLAQVVALAPPGFSTPKFADAAGTPAQDTTADGSGTSWQYRAYATVRKDGKSGRIVAEVHTPGNDWPTDLCELAHLRLAVGGHCQLLTADGRKVAVWSADNPNAQLVADQCAAYRYADGTVVFIAQARGKLAERPLTPQQLATAAVDKRFHLL